MTIADLNALPRDRFVSLLADVFEHSPWVAERAWADRPFATVEDLHASMVRQMTAASRDEQFTLLRAHPDLGARVRMSAASTSEQTGAGLDGLTPDQYRRLQRLNQDYQTRFGFPFIYAVTGRTVDDILDALDRRGSAAPEDEFAEALRQVARIARFRLERLIS